MGEAAECPSPCPQPWGKWSGREAPLPLRSHLLDAAACAGALWDDWLRPGLRGQLARMIAGGDESAARARIMLVVGLHDVGKATPVFQGQLFARSPDPGFAQHLRAMQAAGCEAFAPPRGLTPGSLPGGIVRRHEGASLARLTEAGVWPWSGDAIGRDWAAASAGGHHGVFHVGSEIDDAGDLLSAAFESLTGGVWGDMQQALIDEVAAATGATLGHLRVDLGDDAMTATLLLTGFTIVADWLASAYPGDPEEGFTERSERYAALLPATLGVPLELARAREAVLGPFASCPRRLQLELEGSTEDLVIVGETTGSGKTEAALLRHAALGRIGLMFALPTRATTNAMWGRVRRAFRDVPVAATLLHEHRALDAFYAGPPGGVAAGPYRTEWLESTRHALLAPVAVGTVDQVLVGALHRKHLPVRLLALANRHIVLDEVHTYDPYQRELLHRLLRWWGRTRTPVTMLSATLPKAAQRRFAEAYQSGAAGWAHGGERSDVVYPGLVACNADGGSSARTVRLESARRYRLGVRIRESEASDITASVLAACAERRASAPDSCIGVIVNRIDAAISIGKRLLDAGEPVLVLHSRMSARHRELAARELERRIGAGGARGALTVVGSQVLEASLDIDFDYLISELAPAASLVQRAGRLWRHSAPAGDGSWSHPPTALRIGEGPMLEIVTRAGGIDADGAALPYLVWELSRTLQWLRGRDSIDVPGEVQELVDAAHFDVTELERYEAADELGTLAKAVEHEVSRVRGAARTAVPFGRGGMLDDAWLQTHGALAELTRDIDGDDPEPNGTRFVDVRTETVLLCDPDASGSAFWRGDPLLAVTSKDARISREVIERTIPVRASAIGRQLVDITPEVIAEDRRRQRIRLVRLGQGARYDELLGLCLDTASSQDRGE